MNEMQDKQYLALELTKITFEHSEGYAKRKDVIENYWYFLEDLTGVFEKVARVEELEKENERMRILLSERVEYPDPSVKLHRLIDVVNQCKGDMEPYVYECLMAEIQMKIQ
jgi:uncharacterized protein CbrC (UPF0167 family)